MQIYLDIFKRKNVKTMKYLDEIEVTGNIQLEEEKASSHLRS